MAEESPPRVYRSLDIDKRTRNNRDGRMVRSKSYLAKNLCHIRHLSSLRERESTYLVVQTLSYICPLHL